MVRYVLVVEVDEDLLGGDQSVERAAEVVSEQDGVDARPLSSVVAC